jgi:hypothetical protein
MSVAGRHDVRENVGVANEVRRADEALVVGGKASAVLLAL